MPLLILLFLAVPFIEIWLLIKVGVVIGAGWTIFLVVATAVIGAGLVRAQGLSTIGRIQQEMAAGRLPADEVLQGLFLLVSGALLVTPGFFTDAVGFALLIPPVRRFLAARLFAAGRFGFQVHRPGETPGQSTEPGKTPLEGDFRRED
jgi:UPF0716 protein FxsA